ncbi:hypothetical protein AMECASPLE_038227 [Ameca splendens]|uniref:Uncharacterized protein n=1 Tax=Ameca splendens TaxID=208324 RepID=A0ABV0ZHL4_9TELE
MPQRDKATYLILLEVVSVMSLLLPLKVRMMLEVLPLRGSATSERCSRTNHLRPQSLINQFITDLLSSPADLLGSTVDPLCSTIDPLGSTTDLLGSSADFLGSVVTSSNHSHGSSKDTSTILMSLANV